MRGQENVCPAGVIPAGNGRFWVSLAAFTLGLVGSVSVLLGFFVDARISESRVGIAEDMRAVAEELRESNRLLEQRLMNLERNVQDRWSATNEYQSGMELQERLRAAGLEGFKVPDVYEIKARMAGP